MGPLYVLGPPPLWSRDTGPLHPRSRVPRFEAFSLIRGERFSLLITRKSSSPHHPGPRAGGGRRRRWTSGWPRGLISIFAFALLHSGEPLFNLFRFTYHAYICQNKIKITMSLLLPLPSAVLRRLPPPVEAAARRGRRL